MAMKQPPGGHKATCRKRAEGDITRHQGKQLTDALKGLRRHQKGSMRDKEKRPRIEETDRRHETTRRHTTMPMTQESEVLDSGIGSEVTAQPRGEKRHVEEPTDGETQVHKWRR